ncbi:MAG TPA: glycosyltransferase [Rhizomicrobium sp.]|nr:glycosyltransferase [Rhizomicrobium sp.]
MTTIDSNPTSTPIRSIAENPRGTGDLIFVSMEQWDEIWRRNQFLCAAYARRHPDRKVLFVAPPVDVTNAIRRGRFSDFRGPRTWIVPEYPNITVTQPLKLAPSTLAWGRHLNDAMTRSHVSKISKAAGIRDPILWLNPHWAAHMAGKMGESAVIYDVTDDWTALTQGASSAELVLAQDAQLCRRADAVIVCSKRLYDLKLPIARRVHLIPNGVDAGHYMKVIDGAGILPPEAAAWPRPVLGYTGTVHPDRVDFDLLASIARKWPGSIVLIGPVHRKAALTELHLPNLFLTGAVPYARLPDLMRAFDVCIVPHRVTLFTESLNPIKLWEYLAAGKPVVATDVAGFRDYPELVRIASDADAFVAAARAGMNEDVALREARRREARKHSWTSRVDAIEKVIESCTTH